MANIYYTTEHFEPSQRNPFDENRPYADNWILLKLIDYAEYILFTGRGKGGVFQVIITKRCLDWKFRIMDFIEYETGENMNIVVAVSKDDLVAAEEEYHGHCYMDSFLRQYEKQVLVHSTTWDGWQSINNCGYLKSWNILKSENVIAEKTPIGEKLGDPYDYSDYIMFTEGGVSGEIVVASRQKWGICMDTAEEYKPGARLYLNAEKLADDGLLVRDGVHMKVKGKLELERYLIWVATIETVQLTCNKVSPREFADLSDTMFQEKCGYKFIHILN